MNRIAYVGKHKNNKLNKILFIASSVYASIFSQD